MASATHHSATAVDARDGGFSDKEVEMWMETAVEPITERDKSGDA
ncbi:hypothetical protein [Natronolimnobius sp. AArcel1]|nr:hypothetical protein [Natronolimnobius sp. AArcel1]